MTTTIHVPATIHQTALNISNATGRIAATMNRWTTWDSVCQAEETVRRVSDELRVLKPMLRQLKQEIRRQEVRDRAVIERGKSDV